MSLEELFFLSPRIQRLPMTTFKQFKTVFLLYSKQFKRQSLAKRNPKIAYLITRYLGHYELFVFFTIIITRSLIQHGMHAAALFVYRIFAAYCFVFRPLVMSYLYFSKDNQLLSSACQPRALFSPNSPWRMCPKL